MSRRLRVGSTALSLALAVAGCGGGDPAALATRSSPSRAVTSPGVLLAATTVGDLPVPSTVTQLQARAVAMPDALDGFGRLPGPSEQMRWSKAGAGEIGIDVTDIADIGPGIDTAEQAMKALESQLTRPKPCAEPPDLCLRGRRDEGLTVVWGHVGSPFLFAATAADERQLQRLLAAWVG